MNESTCQCTGFFFNCSPLILNFFVIEHEACIMDLNELQWHVSYSSRTEKRIHGRTHTAEVNNKRLKEEIAFVKRHM